jgi:hypothetical protein
MTEAEWLACEDPRPLLAFLRLRMSYRKQYLFAAASGRRAWDLLPHDSRKAIEVVERYVDGLASLDELEAARAAARAAATVPYSGPRASDANFAAWAVASAVGPDPFSAAMHGFHSRTEDDFVVHGHLFRDLVGNPFRVTTLKRSYLTWNGGTIPKLAASIYEERCLPAGTLDPSRLAILADALEEAGCTDELVLSHCRSTGPHVKGCWPLDLLLGKA